MKKKIKIIIIVIVVILLISIPVFYYMWDTEWKYSGKNKQLISEGSNPVFSPDGTKILFTKSDPSGYTYGLYVINVDGSGLKKVIDVQLERDKYSLSPDNSKILYHINDYHEDDSEIWIVNTDGTDNHQIKTGYHATFSPDGKKIMYATYEQNDPTNWRNRNNTLRLMNLDGSNDTLIMRTYYPNDILHPMFFSNGEKILLCLDNAAAEVERRRSSYDIFHENDTFRPGTWIINLNGSESQHLADDGAAGVSPWTKAVVSENGERIVRYGSSHYHHMSLWTIKTDGTNEVQIMEPSYLGTADISKDGSKVVWAWTYEEGSGLNPSNVMQIVGETDIWISNSDGSDKKALVKGWDPQFSPTEDLVLYSNEGNIFTIEYE